MQNERRKPLTQQRPEPLGRWRVQTHALTVLKAGDLSEGSSKVVVVENQHVREFAESGLAIGQRARETGN
jgi:hypothetical protein